MYVYVHYRNDEKTEIGKDSFGMEIFPIPAFSCEIKLFSMIFYAIPMKFMHFQMRPN
jgi:hypothetical protein